MSDTKPQLPITIRDYCLIREYKHPHFKTLASRCHGMSGWEIAIAHGDNLWVGATYAQFVDKEGNPTWPDPESDAHLMNLRPAKTKVEYY